MNAKDHTFSIAAERSDISPDLILNLTQQFFD